MWFADHSNDIDQLYCKLAHNSFFCKKVVIFNINKLEKKKKILA